LSTKKRGRRPNKNRKSKLFYINALIIALSVILIAVLIKIFVFDKTETTKNIPQNNHKNTQIQTEQDEHSKYEEKTKELEIEYVDDEKPTNTNNQKTKNQTDDIDYAKDIKQALERSNILNDEPKKDENKTKSLDKNTKQKEPETIKKESIQKTEKKPEIKKEENKKQEKIEIKDKLTPIKESKKDEISNVKNPIIAIIIDDVTTKEQVEKIQNIGFPVTMAFMPPTSGHKDSAKIAINFTSHMVHLPLEASNRSNEESNTLHVGDSIETIENRIKQIREWYPNTKYINNHTGSKFTEDEASMDRLIQILKKYNFIFIDSRTTPKTVAKKYTQKYGFRYIARNIFLDNYQTKQTVSEQLKQAVKIAKKTGAAIAIGHPHKITLQTLKESKELLNGVNVVLVDKI